MTSVAEDTPTDPPQPPRAVANERAPDGLLDAEVTRLFDRLMHLRDEALRNKYMLNTTDGDPSFEAALASLGFNRSDRTHWRKGDYPRDLKFTRDLIRILNGKLTRVKAAAKAIAEEVWPAFIAHATPEELSDLRRLHDALVLHRNHLEANREKAKYANNVAAAAKAATATKTAESTEKAVAKAGPEWSAAWVDRQIEPWAGGLLRQRKTRVVVVHGARRSGKGVLIDALYRRLKASEGAPTLLYLNVANLVAQLKPDETQAPTHQRILDRLYGQLCPGEGPWPLPRLHDFEAQFRAVLGQAPPGPICLIILNADACLREPTPAKIKHALDCTSMLFGALNPVAKPKAVAPLDRVSIVVESSRPIRDLDDAYDSSPFNKGVSYPLQRFDIDGCMVLAELAGLTAADGERLHDQTGGHRSLVWAALKDGQRRGPPPTLAPDLAAGSSLVSHTLFLLKQELELQPALRAAFEEACNGQAISNDDGSALSAAMYLAAEPPVAGRAPLLENYLLADLGGTDAGEGS